MVRQSAQDRDARSAHKAHDLVSFLRPGRPGRTASKCFTIRTAEPSVACILRNLATEMLADAASSSACTGDRASFCSRSEAPRAEAGGDAGRRDMGAAAAGRQRDGQGAGAGVPVAEDAGHGRARDAGGFGAGEGRERDLRQPGAAADAARAGDRGGDPRRAAAGGAAAR